MDRLCVFETILIEFVQALAAERRYDSLRYAATGRDHCARSDIPRRIFEEFYAGGGKAEQASRRAEQEQRGSSEAASDRCHEVATMNVLANR
jgi:hypothetical protein